MSPSAAVVPDFWGHPVSQDYVAHPNSAGVPANYAEQQTYPGVVTWVLACVGLAYPAPVARRLLRRRRACSPRALAFGTPSLLEPLTSLPVLRVTLLSRFGFLVIASAIVLAAVGLDALVRRADVAGSEARAGRRGRRRRHRRGDRGGVVGVSRRADCGAAATEGDGGRAVLGRRRGADRWAGLRLRPRAGRRIGVRRGGLCRDHRRVGGVRRRRTQLGGRRRCLPVDAGDRDGPAGHRPVPRPRGLRRPAREHRDGIRARGPARLRRHGAARVERPARRQHGLQRLVSHAHACGRLAPGEPAEREVRLRLAGPRSAGATVHARVERAVAAVREPRRDAATCSSPMATRCGRATPRAAHCAMVWSISGGPPSSRPSSRADSRPSRAEA